MSIEIARDVMERSPHAGTAKTLLLCLAIMADREGCCYPSHRTLARYCNVDERQIRRCLRTLEAAGDIQTEGGQGAQTAHGSTNRYRLLGVPASPASPVAPAAPSHWGDTQTPPGGVPLSGGGLQTPPREDIQTPSWGDIQTLPGGVPMSRGGVQDPPGGVYMSSLGGVCRPPRKVIGKVIGKERDDTLTVDAGDDTDDTDDTSSDASLPGDAGVPEAVATAAAPEPPQPVYHRDLLQSDAALDEATLAHLERTQPPLCGTRQRSGGGAAADRAKGTSTARSPRDTTPAPTALPFADPTPPSPSPRAGGGRAAAAADEGTLPDPFAPAGTPGARSRSRLLDPREIARGAAADEEAVQRKVEETLARRPHWREPLDVWSAGKPDYHQARANKVAYWLANPDTAPKKAAEENPYRRPLIRVGDPGWEQRLFPS